MAKTKQKAIESSQLDEMSNEDMQALILRTQLKREMMLLGKTEEEVRLHEAHEQQKETDFAQRQRDLEAVAANAANTQRRCRHRQGGKHQNVLKGDGPPCVTATMMLDGYTIRLACTRCRKTVYRPNPMLEQTDAKLYAKEKAEFDKFMEMFEDSGLDMIRGPEFIFAKNGIPFIPVRA
jgi:hypothetical protein